MADIHSHQDEPTAVDDVRHVREKIAREHAGDLHRHVEETNRIATELLAKLNVRIVPPTSPDTKRAVR